MEPSSLLQTLPMKIFEAINKRDLSVLEDHLSDAVVFDFPGPGRIESKRRVLVFLKLLLRKYPELTFSVSETLVDGPRACLVWSNNGITAAGELYRNRGVTLVHVSEEKIDFISDYFKDTSFVESK